MALQATDMTAAEIKANELVDKFKPLVTTWDCYWDAALPDEEITKDAKKCALICIETVLSEINPDDHEGNKKKFWEEVKSEIEKM